MRTLLALLIFTLVVPVSAQVSTTPVQGLRTKTVRLVAYVNCTAIPEPGQRIDSAVIIVRDNRIVSVGKNAAIPNGADVRDLHGAFVYAGFVDPYVDVADLGAGRKNTRPAFNEEDEGPNTPPQQGAHHWNEAVRPERIVTDALRLNDETAKTWNKLGYTTLGISSHDGIFSGSMAVATAKAGSASEVVIADHVAQRLGFQKGSSKTPYPSSLMGSIALIRQTLMDAAWYGKAIDAKGLPQNELPEPNVSLEALHQAVTAKTPFIVEATDEHDVQRWHLIAKEAGIPIIVKGSGSEYRRYAMLAPYKGPIILPMTTPETPDVRDPVDARNVGLTDLIHWYWAADNPRIMDSVGYSIAFTLDGLKDKTSALKQLRLFAKRGWTRDKALAALTTVPAKILSVDDQVGRIAPKYAANLVMMSKDLFDDDAIIRAVIVDGQQYDIAPTAKIDVRGTWTLTSKALPSPVTVTIKGTAEQPSASMKMDTTDLSSTFSLSNNTISMSVRADMIKPAGTLRTSLRADSILMNGSWLMVDGTTVPLVMRRDSTYDERAEPRSVVIESRRPLPTWLPLGPFGLDGVPPQEDVILKNATVWTMGKDSILTEADVRITGGKIAAVGKGLTGGKEIDCSGMHITPGIIDEHSHIAITRGVNEGTHAVTTEVRIGDVLDPDDVNIYRQLSGGVTGTHLLHGSANPMGGQLQFIRMRWGADAEGIKQQGAKPTVKFALGENVKQSNWGDKFRTRYPQTRMGVEEIMRDAFQAAREYERKRKAASLGGAPVRQDIQLDALVEILNSERNIHCHSYVQSEILMLMRLAEEFGFKVHTFTHILEGYKVASEMAKHGAGASSFADWWAYKFEVYDAIPESPAIMHEQGVTVSINSDDAEMARRLNQEAAKSIAYGGVSEYDAMKFVTLNAAKQMVAEDRVGSIEVGKEADIVVWNGNPLSNMTRVERTFVEGRQYFSREQDAKLRVRDAELRTFLEQQAMAAANGGAPTAPPSRKQRREYECETMDDEMAGTGHHD